MTNMSLNYEIGRCCLLRACFRYTVTKRNFLPLRKGATLPLCVSHKSVVHFDIRIKLIKLFSVTGDFKVLN